MSNKDNLVKAQATGQMANDRGTSFCTVCKKRLETEQWREVTLALMQEYQGTRKKNRKLSKKLFCSSFLGFFFSFSELLINIDS